MGGGVRSTAWAVRWRRRFPRDQVHFTHSTTDARAAAQRLEGVAAAFYPAKIDEAVSEELKDDLARALGQHRFHAHVLEQMG